VAQPTNRRLTTLDASFLYVEKANQPMHVGSVGVYEGMLTRQDVIDVLNARLHQLPRYRQKVVFPPFGINHPTWEDDTAFDIRQHIDEATLPKPGDDRALSEGAGRLFAQVLDRAHPLWKLIVLHGHESGNTMLLSMVHHAMVDGVSGVDLTMIMHELTADAAPPEPPAAPWEPRPQPDPLTLLQDAVRDRMTETAQSWTDESFRLFRPQELNRRAEQITNAITTSMPFLMQPAPRTPFNGPLSGERQFSWAQFSFSEVRAIRATLGGTVNDVVLAVLAGGLGRYLERHDYPTIGIELRAMCPVSMRRPEEQGALGNLVSMMFAPLYVGIKDPVERLNAERQAMERLKTGGQAAGLFALTDFARNVPPTWQAFASQFDVPNTLLNTVSTNVPGPQIPLYLAGKKLLHWYPLGPLASNIGLFVAILSYNQVLTMGTTVDPKQVPDPWVFAECLQASFAELRDAAAQAASSRGAPEAAPAKNGGAARRTKQLARA